MAKKAVSDDGRRWVSGRMPSADYFAKVYEAEKKEARKDVNRLLARGVRNVTRRGQGHTASG